MSKPIDLIVANELHRIAEAIEKMPPVLRAGTTAADFKTEVARQVLCKISHEASAAAVVRALESVGVCGGVDGLAQRLAAIDRTYRGASVISRWARQPEAVRARIVTPVREPTNTRAGSSGAAAST